MRANLEKPAFGAPCNKCGYCCTVNVCALGSFTLKLVKEYGDRAKGPCPALAEHRGEMVCNMVRRPERHAWGLGTHAQLRDAVNRLLGVGFGCDDLERGPDDPIDGAEQARFERWAIENLGDGKSDAALKRWFGVK